MRTLYGTESISLDSLGRSFSAHLKPYLSGQNSQPIESCKERNKLQIVQQITIKMRQNIQLQLPRRGSSLLRINRDRHRQTIWEAPNSKLCQNCPCKCRIIQFYLRTMMLEWAVTQTAIATQTTLQSRPSMGTTTSDLCLKEYRTSQSRVNRYLYSLLSRMIC